MHKGNLFHSTFIYSVLIIASSKSFWINSYTCIQNPVYHIYQIKLEEIEWVTSNNIYKLHEYSSNFQTLYRVIIQKTIWLLETVGTLCCFYETFCFRIELINDPQICFVFLFSTDSTDSFCIIDTNPRNLSLTFSPAIREIQDPFKEICIMTKSLKRLILDPLNVTLRWTFWSHFSFPLTHYSNSQNLTLRMIYLRLNVNVNKREIYQHAVSLELILYLQLLIYRLIINVCMKWKL